MPQLRQYPLAFPPMQLAAGEEKTVEATPKVDCMPRLLVLQPLAEVAPGSALQVHIRVAEREWMAVDVEIGRSTPLVLPDGQVKEGESISVRIKNRGYSALHLAVACVVVAKSDGPGAAEYGSFKTTQTIAQRAERLIALAQNIEQMLDGRLPPLPKEYDTAPGVIDVFEPAEAAVRAVTDLPDVKNPEHVSEVLRRYLERQPTLQPHQIQIALKLLSQQVQELAALIGELAKR